MRYLSRENEGCVWEIGKNLFLLYVGIEREGGRVRKAGEARWGARKGRGRKRAPRVTAVVEAQDAVSQYYRCVKPPRLS